MEPLRLRSSVEQVADRLRDDLSLGRLRGDMPGVLKLEEQLGVNRNTIESALRILESEGWLRAEGKGRKRHILGRPPSEATKRRIAILDYDPPELTQGYISQLPYLLGQAGHDAFFAARSLTELKMDLRRVKRLVEMTPADAWVVTAGSREILEWFAARGEPVLALFGRRRGLRIAGVGPDKPPAVAAATRRLLELGHRRIVLMARTARRKPEPGATERSFLREIAAAGIQAGSYHLPDWGADQGGFCGCLDALFQLTPPTALIIEEAVFYITALQYCAHRGLRVPADVSLVCTDADPGFVWSQPSVAHIRWDHRPVVRRILRWAANVGLGVEDVRQTLTTATFVDGGTMGPAS
ncbi:MAG: substrate-binding domain-containing protein [Akkermansiaceae bacterium]|jgi:DNA-binding LacI/PurR family transcriptional regulator|nr:substrate-binding domain-containing protein [Akkermansiaceae bacterium]